MVTPCVGVWIEIDTNGAGLSRSFVTPCVGVWIEIFFIVLCYNVYRSHSLRGSVD